MPINSCSSPALPPQNFPLSSATRARAAGLSSQQADNSRSYRFTQRHNETPFQASLRDYSREKTYPKPQRASGAYAGPVQTPAASKPRQSSSPYPSTVEKQAHSRLRQSPSIRSSPMESQAKPKLAISPRSDSSSVKAQARHKPPLRSAPVTTPVRQAATRTLYSDKDAQRDLSSLTDSTNLLTASKQFNRKRMSEAQIENVEDIGKDIKTLMQKIKKTDPTSLDTSAFRKQTIRLKSRVEDHLRDISTTQVRQMPPRPALMKRPQPQTDVAIERQKKHAARRDQFSTFRKEQRKQLEASGQSQKIEIEWKHNLPVTGIVEENTNADAPANSDDFLNRLIELFADEDSSDTLSAVDEPNLDIGFLSESDDESEPAEEKTDESTRAGVRHLLNGLYEFLAEDDPLRISPDNDQFNPDNGYISQDSSRDSSLSISPKLKKQVSWSDKKPYQEETPSNPHRWAKGILRVRPLPTQKPEGI